MDRETAVPSVVDLPGERSREWVAYQHRYAAPSTYVYDFVWDTTADAAGPFCTDVDGNVLLDFASHVAAAPLGYDHPEVTARLEEVGALEPAKIAGNDFYAAASWPPDDADVPGPAQLMERLVESTSHYGMDTVFLSNSGAEAVENAIKICYDHTDGKYGITFEGAFHGRTLGALSLNRSKAVQRRGFPEIPSVHDVPYCDDRRCDADTCDCGFFTGEGSRLGRKLSPDQGHIDPEEVAYVVVEPIQGEGGYRVPSEAFMDEVATLCARYDVPLIADEIQSGMGRTGEMWASDHYAIEPDVVAAAKGLRVGATVSNSDIFPEERGRLSSTWGGGDLLGALAGAVTFEVIEEEGLLDNAVARGEQCLALLREAAPEFVVDVRGKGLMLGVEFDTRARRDAALHACFRRGLLTLGCGHQTLRLLPPLDVREREIRLAVDVFAEALDDRRVQRAEPPVRHDEDWDEAG